MVRFNMTLDQTHVANLPARSRGNVGSYLRAALEERFGMRVRIIDADGEFFREAAEEVISNLGGSGVLPPDAALGSKRAHGGFGSIYEVRGAGRPLVLKVSDAAAYRGFGRRTLMYFGRELEAVFAVSGRATVLPDVIAGSTAIAYRVFREAGELRLMALSFYMMRDYGPEPDLAHRMLDRKEWTTEEVTELAVDVLTALSILHGEGYVHGDVCPRNIFFDPLKKHYVLCDFGTVKNMRERHRETALFNLGNWPFPRSEEVAQVRASGRFSVYSPLYDLLTLANTLKSLLSCCPADARRRAAEACVDKARSGGYPSARSFIEGLANCYCPLAAFAQTEGSPVPAPQEKKQPKRRKTRAKRPRRGKKDADPGMAAAILIGLLAGNLLGLILTDQTPREAAAELRSAVSAAAEQVGAWTRTATEKAEDLLCEGRLMIRFSSLPFREGYDCSFRKDGEITESHHLEGRGIRGHALLNRPLSGEEAGSAEYRCFVADEEGNREDGTGGRVWVHFGTWVLRYGISFPTELEPGTRHYLHLVVGIGGEEYESVFPFTA